jgi:hypothetical protein
MSTEVFSLGVKQPGGEADQSPLPSAHVTNVKRYFIPQHVFKAQCLNKHKYFRFKLLQFRKRSVFNDFMLLSGSDDDDDDGIIITNMAGNIKNY